MEIDDSLVLQWEPKIQKMVSTVFVVGMDRDDIAQELRIALIKTAKAFDPDRGVIFHTYLHTALVNTIRTLISRAQKELQIETRSLDVTFGETNLQSSEILEALKDPVDQEDLLELDDYIESLILNENEQMFLQLRLEGLTMEEITEDLGESAYKVRQALREKFSDLGYD